MPLPHVSADVPPAVARFDSAQLASAHAAGIDPFRGERWEKQLRESRFPRKRFGFVQCEVEHMFVLLEPIAKLGRNLFANVCTVARLVPLLRPSGRQIREAKNRAPRLREIGRVERSSR